MLEIREGRLMVEVTEGVYAHPALVAYLTNAGILDNFIRACRRDYPRSITRLSGAFNWGGTGEGYEFWSWHARYLNHLERL